LLPTVNVSGAELVPIVTEQRSSVGWLSTTGLVATAATLNVTEKAPPGPEPVTVTVAETEPGVVGT
jgi:hypothetical protein